MADVPQWLANMRVITGTTETPGDADNPKILAMADEIARIWGGQPGMDGIEAYCAQYTHDSIAWCGLTVGFCVSEAGYRPAYKPPPADDTDRFLWAQSFASDDNFVEISQPVPGAIVVMTRSGGGHVTLFEEWSGEMLRCRGGNQSDAINVQSYDPDDVIAYVWPRGAPMPNIPRAELSRGDSGPDVEYLQTVLGLPVDGEFGPTTQGGVIGFQQSCGLDADGVVGEQTWAEVDDLKKRLDASAPPLSAAEIEQISDIARNSEIAEYSWRDRGRAPVGYVVGHALAFATAVRRLELGTSDAGVMAAGERGQPDTDVLSWYKDEFEALEMDNKLSSVSTMRHLFALQMGLGMRESSGRYCEGRDTSASNTSPDTAEAGLFQTSWNIRSCSSAIPPLLSEFNTAPQGFLEQYDDGVTPSGGELQNYGDGQDGTVYQWLSKYCPLFHTLVTGVGMRRLRQHWGPLNRKEAELRREADEMLKDVQEFIEGREPAPPDPQPATVDIQISASGPVTVTVNGTPIGEV